MSRAERSGGLRFVGSELSMVFGRRRNLVLLAILALVPVLIAVAVKAGRHDPRGGGAIFGSITGNGLFAALAALLVAGPLFLPLVIAVVAGDSMAGEASTGTLRYLLAVPVSRGRLIGTKLAAIVVWCAACVLVIAAVGVLVGLVLFPSGQLTLLSGRSVGYVDGLWRLAGASAYVSATVVTVGAIGLFASTMTEVPIAAMAATLTLTIISEVADAVPQLSTIHPWLPTHYWQRWIDLLRDPVFTADIRTGLWVSLAYFALFTSLAWARFATKDVTS